MLFGNIKNKELKNQVLQKRWLINSILLLTERTSSPKPISIIASIRSPIFIFFYLSCNSSNIIVSKIHEDSMSCFLLGLESKDFYEISMVCKSFLIICLIMILWLTFDSSVVGFIWFLIFLIKNIYFSNKQYVYDANWLLYLFVVLLDVFGLLISLFVILNLLFDLHGDKNNSSLFSKFFIFILYKFAMMKSRHKPFTSLFSNFCDFFANYK